jgi:3-dehydroquinate dehydratase/shikimate dehydrogenase
VSPRQALAVVAAPEAVRPLAAVPAGAALAAAPEPRVTLVATLTAPPSAGLPPLPPAVDGLEVRADLAGEIGAAWLRCRFAGRLLYTLRSAREGGAFAGSDGERRRRLAAAAADGYDLVDLEAARDLTPALLAAVPAERRVVSSHGGAAALPALRRRLDRALAVPARLYRLSTAAAAPADALPVLALLAGLGRRDVVAFATGEAAFWSRLVAPRLGAPFVFAAAGPSGGDLVPASRLVRDFDLPCLAPATRLYGIAGRASIHSRAPRLHNAGYRALGLDALHLPFPVADGGFGEAWRGLVESDGLAELGLPIAGLVVTSPHKETALEVARLRRGVVARAGAANYLVPVTGRGGRRAGWRAGTADPAGVLDNLRQRGFAVAGARVALVGVGGTGRAAAAALQRAGARVTLANRSAERGRRAASALGLPFVPLADLSVRGFSVLVNATPIGRYGEETPFAIEELDRGGIVVDHVYGAGTTPLVARARACGLAVVDGYDVLYAQTRQHFQALTGRRFPLSRQQTAELLAE